MGSTLGKDQLEEIKSQSTFTEDEIKKIFKRFQLIDLNKNGTLSYEEFARIPELEHNPLVKRVIATMDADHSGEVDFKEFITVLTIFASQTSKEIKAQFTFRIYDVDGDGFISNADLFQILKAMVGSNLNETQLQQLVDRTILKGDKDKDGKLSYSEFTELTKETGFTDKLSIFSNFNSYLSEP